MFIFVQEVAQTCPGYINFESAVDSHLIETFKVSWNHPGRSGYLPRDTCSPSSGAARRTILHGEFTFYSRSVYRHQRNSTHCIGDSQSLDTLVERYGLINHRDQLVGDIRSHPFRMPLRTAGPLLGVPTRFHPLPSLLTERAATLTFSRLNPADNRGG